MADFHSRRDPAPQGPALLSPAGRERPHHLCRLCLGAEPAAGRDREALPPPHGAGDVRRAGRGHLPPEVDQTELAGLTEAVRQSPTFRLTLAKNENIKRTNSDQTGRMDPCPLMLVMCWKVPRSPPSCS